MLINNIQVMRLLDGVWVFQRLNTLSAGWSQTKPDFKPL